MALKDMIYFRKKNGGFGMGLKNITENDLKNDLEKYLSGVIMDDVFLNVETKEGNAVIISEAEWNIMRESLNIVLKGN